jgi:hypothetical protein
MRLSTAFSIVCVFAAACGDDGGTTVADAPAIDAGKDTGFTRPVASLKANHDLGDDPNTPETEKNRWEELGPANLACLDTPSSDVPSATAVTIDTVVRDFQSGGLVPHTQVTAFADQDFNTPFGAAVTSDSSTAAVAVDIPAGTTRFGYKMVNPEVALDTLLLNQKLDGTNPQMEEKIQSVSTQTAATLPALIGVSRTAGTGILAGALRDCDDHEISNFIATVSSTEAAADSKVDDVVTPLPGVDVYYFSPGVGLPVRHTQQHHASKDGLFMAIEMQPNPTAYIQMWGYVTDADVAADNLRLIAQLKTQVIGDVVITGSYEPLRQ